MADDAARVALYRSQRASRIAHRQMIELSLAGDPVAAAAVRAGFQPLIDAALQAQMPEEIDIGDSLIVKNQNVDF
jgi:hypothetical protein